MARRTAAEAAETRRDIVAAARELFTEVGYAATGTADVVARAGVTRGALYHHFDDKQDLFRAVFAELVDELNEAVLARAAAESDPFDAFLMACRESMAFMERADYQQIAVVDAPAVLGPQEWHAVDAGVGVESMEGGLWLLAAAGRLDVPPSRALAVVLFGALTEAGLAASRGDGDADELFDAFCLLVDRLSASGSGEPSGSGRR